MKCAYTNRYIMKVSVESNPPQTTLSKGNYLLTKFKSTKTVKLQVEFDRSRVTQKRDWSRQAFWEGAVWAENWRMKRNQRCEGPEETLSRQKNRNYEEPQSGKGLAVLRRSRLVWALSMRPGMGQWGHSRQEEAGSHRLSETPTKGLNFILSAAEDTAGVKTEQCHPSYLQLRIF